MAPSSSEDVKVPLQNVYNPTTIEGFIVEDNTSSGKGPKDSILLYLSAFTATFATLGWGGLVVWTSTAVGKLTSNNTEENPLGVPATTYQISLIGGLPMFGATFGALVLTKLCDIIGRKGAILVISMMLLISTLVLAFTGSINMYYICRFVSGLGGGAATSIVSIFLSEVSEDHNRGKIGCLIGLSFPLGNLYSYVLGHMFSVKIFTLLCAVPFIINLIAFVLFVPETPIYLSSKGRRQSAIRSLEKLRNKNPSSIEKEYESIMYTIHNSSETDKAGFKALLSTRALKKGLLISMGIVIIQMFSGISGILIFAGPLFDAAKINLSGNMVGILIGLVKLFSVFSATVIIERAGKKPLLLISTFGSGVFLFILGLFFCLQSMQSPIVQQILWLPVASVLLYFFFYGIGIGAISQSIMSELFPSSVRAIAVSTVTFVTFCVGAVITLAFPILNEMLGEMWCLWGFSVCCLIGTVFIYIVVPEIKGKSLLEVQEILSR